MGLGNIMTRTKWIGVLVVAAASAGIYRTDFWRAERFRERIRAALERSLGRRVVLQGEIRYNVLTGPGFQADEVTIHEAPEHGREPFAYVSTLEARINWTRLLRGQLDFGTLVLGEPSLNVSRGGPGGMNVTPLVEKALLARRGEALPDVLVRGGRINFVLNRTKSVFYLRAVDLDFTPIDESSFQVRFEGEPARTDRRAVGFGRFLASGRVTFPRQGEPSIDVSLDLNRSNAAEVVSLFEPKAVHMDGRLSTEARLQGPLSNIGIEGKLSYDPSVRQDLVPLRSRALPVNYRGRVDLREQTLAIDALPADNPDVPQLAMRFRSREILQNPRWAGLLILREIDAAPLLNAWRGGGIAERVGLEGKISGAFGWSNGVGRGMARLDSKPGTKVESGELMIDGHRVTLESRARDVEIAPVRSLLADLAGIEPGFLADVGEGRLDGEVAYRNDGRDSEVGRWSGRFLLRGAQLTVPGVAERLTVEQASITLDENRLEASGIRVKAGKIVLEGGYRYEPGVAMPHRLNLAAVEADSTEVERLLAPTLERSGGIVARTLGLGGNSVPDWLAGRHAEGTWRVGTLNWRGRRLEAVRGRFRWNGPSVEVMEIESNSGRGALNIDLSVSPPKTEVVGSFQNSP